MASTNWTELSDNPSSSVIRRGAVAGLLSPNGGDAFNYGFNAPGSNAGYCGLYESDGGFNPLISGGGVSGAMVRLQGSPIGATPTGPAPMLFCCLQGVDSAELAYMLGLSASDPSQIILRKGRPFEGLPNVPPGPGFGILARGSKAVDLGVWVQLRLDVQRNGNGDVVLNCFMNDLTANPVTAPVWVPIPGFPLADVNGAQLIDDALGANTGSVPLTAGRLGFGVFTQVPTVVAFDSITALNQT